MADVRARVNAKSGALTDTLLIHWANIGQDITYTQLLPVLSPKMTASKKEEVIIPVDGYELPPLRQVRRVLISGKKAKRKEIDEINSADNSFGASEQEPFYVEWSGKIEFYPVTLMGGSTARHIRIDYLKPIVAFSESVLVSSLPEEYHGLIIDYVEMMALRKLNRVDAANAAEQTIAGVVQNILGANAATISSIEAAKGRS